MAIEQQTRQEFIFKVDCKYLYAIAKNLKWVCDEFKIQFLKDGLRIQLKFF